MLSSEQMVKVMEVLDALSIPEPNSGCRLWLGQCDAAGYGTIGLFGKRHYAHRLAYAAYVGPIPSGKFVCHHCDMPGCIEKIHLFCGTPRDNTADMMRKGRNTRLPVRRGEDVPSSKLLIDDVRQIKEILSSNTGISLRAIGRQFGVDCTTIIRIRDGEYWKHV